MERETQAEYDKQKTCTPIEGALSQQRHQEHQQTDSRLHDGITRYGCRKAVTVFFIRIAVHQDIFEEMSQSHSDTSAIKSPVLITHDEQQDKCHIIRGLEEEVRERIAPRQRDIGHRQRHHLQIHRQRGHLRHLHHREKLRAEEQRDQDRQRQHQGCQHR